MSCLRKSALSPAVAPSPMMYALWASSCPSRRGSGPKYSYYAHETPTARSRRRKEAGSTSVCDVRLLTSAATVCTMPLIITPGQLSRRADFYYQLAQLTSAGLTLMHALEHLKQNPPSFSYRVHIRNLLEDLKHGYTFTESLRRQKGWLPAFDVALLHAGEHSGRLESCFRLLTDQ